MPITSTALWLLALARLAWIFDACLSFYSFVKFFNPFQAKCTNNYNDCCSITSQLEAYIVIADVF